jgi:broad specificity phosphatase PhoE
MLSKFYKANNLLDKAKITAKEGYCRALALRNSRMIAEFTKLFLPRRIILFRHGEADKNINAVINGSGALTEQGIIEVEKAIASIKAYLEAHGYDIQAVEIYGSADKKQQVKGTLEIIKNNGFSNDRIHYAINELRPTNMGVLAGVSEINPPEKLKDAFKLLQRWRNNTISLADFNIEGMEEPAFFWERAKRFLETIKGNECSIIVCTTSMAILLTHCLTMDELDLAAYKHLHIPLCGIVHFVETEDGDFQIVNKDNDTNICFSAIEND